MKICRPNLKSIWTLLNDDDVPMLFENEKALDNYIEIVGLPKTDSSLATLGYTKKELFIITDFADIEPIKRYYAIQNALKKLSTTERQLLNLGDL